MRQELVTILETVDLSKYIKEIQKYLLTKHDPMKATAIRKEIEKGDINSVNDLDAENIIRLLKNDKTNVPNINFTKSQLKSDQDQVSKSVYDVTLQENEQLRKTISEIKTQLKEQNTILEQYKGINLKEVKSILEENKKFRKMFLLTEIKDLIAVEDEDINELYLKYTSNNAQVSKTAFISNKNNKPIIPKTYYLLD